MDLSKEYVMMCEKAREIQALKHENSNYDECDFVQIHGELGKIFCIKAKHVGIKRNDVWLPRQDQLQGMHPYKDIIFQMGDCYHWGRIVVRKQKLFSSMEQLWLAFVMKERFGKKWDGEDWKNFNEMLTYDKEI